MTSTPIEMTENAYGKWVYDLTVDASKICIAANLPKVGVLSAYILDTNLPKPAFIDCEEGTTPNLWVNAIVGMKIKLVCDVQPDKLVIIK